MSEMRSGVYEIKNIKNNKIYIGGSINISERWNEHRRELSKNNHHSPHLQNAWNKYGEDCFNFNVLEWCHEDDVFDREQYYLDTYKSYDKNNGYNIAKYASAPMKGRKHTEETKKILLEDLKNRDKNTWLRGEESPNSKLKNEDIAEIKRMIYEGYKICDIADLYDVKPNTITQIKTGERWKHINTKYDDLIKQTPKQKLTHENIIQIKRLLIDNNLTITEIANFYNVTPGMISAIKSLRSHKNIGVEYNKQLEGRHSVRKLNKEKVLEIEVMLKNDISCKDIAKKYNVVEKTIKNIKNKDEWQNVTS